MRCDTGTKFDEDSVTTRLTKSTIACLAGVSFHDGNGSAPHAQSAGAKRSKVASKVLMFCLTAEDLRLSWSVLFQFRRHFLFPGAAFLHLLQYLIEVEAGRL